MMNSSILTLVVIAQVLFLGSFAFTIDPYSRSCHSSASRCSNLLRSQPNDDDPTQIGGDLVTALARIDKQWGLAKRNEIGDWQVLELKENEQQEGSDTVYLLEPASGASPSCVIFFLGGAVLGQFPHIAYSEFLKRLAVRMGAAVVAIPYEVGLDHFSIAQKGVKLMKSALIECEDVRGYSSSIPKYNVGHSLGGKLHSIGMAATGVGEDVAGCGMISYNNFGFAQTIQMARAFSNELQVSKNPRFGEGGPMPFDALFDLASNAINAVGLEFSPSPDQTDQIIAKKFDENLLQKTRLFSFQDDELDSTGRFVDCFRSGATEVSLLPGSHLTPVFLRLGIDDFPEEARDMASQTSGGFQNISFGDEDLLDQLVDEVSNWMLGKPPTRSADFSSSVAGLIDAEIIAD